MRFWYLSLCVKSYSGGARGLNIGLDLCMLPYFVSESSEGSGETEQGMHGSRKFCQRGFNFDSFFFFS